MSSSYSPLEYSNGPNFNKVPSAPLLDDEGLPPAYEPQQSAYESASAYQPSAYQPNMAAPSSGLPEPSAPFLNPVNRDLEHLSYDQVVFWWNALDEAQREKMKTQGARLSLDQITELRKDYQKYYPKEYYPKEIYSKDQLSACDYYLMYYLCEEMAQDYHWFDQSLLKAFEVPPPPYDDLAQPPTYEEATRWWNGLPSQERQRLENRKFQEAQIVFIQREYRPYYRVYYAERHFGSGLDFYDYYLMSRYPSRFYGYPLWARDDYLLFNSLRASFELTRLAARGAYHAAGFLGRGLMSLGNVLGSGLKATGGFLGSIGNNALSGGGSGGGSSNKDNKGALAILVGIAIVVGTIVAAASAVVGSLYTGIKAAASTANLAQGRKWARSLWRLACMGAGAYVGATQGAVIGALVGSLVPGVGTLAGAIIGAIFGAPITAALAGAFAKYSAQLVSWARTGSTNPEKWDVQKTKQAMDKSLGRFSMNTAQIKELFSALREQKNKFKTIKGAMAGSSDNTEKNRFNKFLDAIKSGLDPRQGIRVDSHTRFKWDSEKHVLERENVELPALKSGLRL